MPFLLNLRGLLAACAVLAGAALSTAGTTAQAALLIDDTFGNGNLATGGSGDFNGGFNLVFNGPGDDSSAGEAGGLATVISHNRTANAGLASKTGFSLAEGPAFYARYVVGSISSQPQFNGVFLGFSTTNTGFYRTVSNIGLSLFGNGNVQDSGQGLALVINDGGPGPDFIPYSNENSVQLASLLDGFTAELWFLPSGWSLLLEGLSTAAGVPTTFDASGLWPGGFDYREQFSATQYAVAYVQRGETGSPDITHRYDRITVSAIPEPSTWLLIVGGAGLALVMGRRRGKLKI